MRVQIFTLVYLFLLQFFYPMPLEHKDHLAKIILSDYFRMPMNDNVGKCLIFRTTIKHKNINFFKQ